MLVYLSIETTEILCVCFFCTDFANEKKLKQKSDGIAVRLLPDFNPTKIILLMDFNKIWRTVCQAFFCCCCYFFFRSFVFSLIRMYVWVTAQAQLDNIRKHTFIVRKTALLPLPRYAIEWNGQTRTFSFVLSFSLVHSIGLLPSVRIP